MEIKERISTLDGLRALAAFGVLWIHAWTAHGNARCNIFGIDVASIMAIGGNGVDLFFVISGFCMYYFYANKKEFNLADMLLFLKKRWLRLSPAFYVATLVYLLTWLFVYHDQLPVVYSMLTSLFYLNGVTNYTVASHFWTLTVEWQFYLALPFIFLYQHKIGFWRILAVVFGIQLLIAISLVVILKRESDFWTNQIFFRGVEFACGIIPAYCY